MTYEEFKKELCRNVQGLKEAEGKQLQLLDRRMICADKETMRIIRRLNLRMHGKEDMVLHEDVLYAFWKSSGRENLLYWPARPLYECYKKEGWQSILPEMAASLRRTGKENGENPWDGGGYEECRGRLILRPLNYDRNRHELEDCIYWRIGDMALVLYVLVNDTPGEMITLKLRQEITADWKIPEERLLTEALLNSYTRMPPRLYHSDDIRSHISSAEGVFMPGEAGMPTQIHPGNRWEGMRGYRLTTNRQINGALAIFYPGVRERLAEILGGDYYVGFTSVHEAIIHPVYCKNLPEIKSAIQHVNAVFGEQDMLTNTVFCYNRIRKELQEM